MTLIETKSALSDLIPSPMPALSDGKYLIRQHTEEELIAAKISRSSCPDEIKPLLKGLNYYGSDSKAHYLY